MQILGLPKFSTITIRFFRANGPRKTRLITIFAAKMFFPGWCFLRPKICLSEEYFPSFMIEITVPENMILALMKVLAFKGTTLQDFFWNESSTNNTAHNIRKKSTALKVSMVHTTSTTTGELAFLNWDAICYVFVDGGAIHTYKMMMRVQILLTNFFMRRHWHFLWIKFLPQISSSWPLGCLFIHLFGKFSFQNCNNICRLKKKTEALDRTYNQKSKSLLQQQSFFL